DLDDRRKQLPVAIRSLSAPPTTNGFLGDPNWVGALDFAVQGGGGVSGGGGVVAGGRGAAALEPPATSSAPSQVVSADQGNAAVALNTAPRPEISTFRARYGLGGGAGGGGTLPQEQRLA